MNHENLNPQDDPLSDGPIVDFYDDEDEDDEPTTGGGAAVRKLHCEVDAAFDEPTGTFRLFELSAGARTDPGTKRANNEDSMLVLEDESLFVVADGMGGHAGGEVASQLAVEAMASTFLEKARTPCILSNVPPRAVQLVQGFAAANEAIRSAASKNPVLSDMGTTVVAARFCPNKGRAYIGHVGDSRCYRLRESKLEQITKDHTLAEYGVVGRESHALSRAVGSNGIVETDLVVVEPREGDVFLLCSDGLNKSLSDDVIHEVLDNEPDPDRAAAELIARANTARARDNVTAIVVRIGAGASPRSS
jgi:serine/threonine protein phosphatase PrpC